MTRLRAAVIGCGNRGAEHAAAYAALAGDARLVAVADVDRGRADRLAARLDVPAFTDAGDMLDAVRPEVVSIATQPAGRVELVERCAAAPSVRAIVCEKPLALSLAAGQRMVEAAARTGTAFVVGHQLRYTTEFRAVREAVERGDCGEIEFLRGVSYGNVFGQGTHLVDAMRWLLDGAAGSWAMASWADPPEAAAALRESRSLRVEASMGPLWLVGYVAFANGVRATLEMGVRYERARAPFLYDWLQKRVTVVGTRGTADACVATHGRVISVAGSTELASDEADWDAATGRMLADVLACARRGEQPPGGGADALRTLEILLALVEAARAGGVVELPLAPGRDPVAELNRLRRPRSVGQ